MVARQDRNFGVPEMQIVAQTVDQHHVGAVADLLVMNVDVPGGDALHSAFLTDCGTSANCVRAPSRPCVGRTRSR